MGCAVTAVKLSARLLKKALKNGKLTARDIKEAGLDELVGFADDLATLANPDSTLVDRALAVLSLTVGLGKDEIDAISGGIKHIAGKGKKHAKRGEVGKYLSDNWHKGTFPNKTQSLAYHLKKHGKGRTASQFTKDAQDFFAKNKQLGQPTTLKDGTPGIKIQTKTKVNGKTVRVGGYWTTSGKLVTYWD